MPAKIKPADLNKCIEILDQVDKPNSNNGLTPSRVPMHKGKIWAKVDIANSYKVNSWRAHTSDREKITHIFTIRERCDFEISPKMWIFREYRGRDEWYKIIAERPLEDGFNHYVQIAASLWRRDSERLSENQDVPCGDIKPDDGYFDHRDLL